MIDRFFSLKSIAGASKELIFTGLSLSLKGDFVLTNSRGTVFNVLILTVTFFSFFKVFDGNQSPSSLLSSLGAARKSVWLLKLVHRFTHVFYFITSRSYSLANVVIKTCLKVFRPLSASSCLNRCWVWWFTFILINLSI